MTPQPHCDHECVCAVLFMHDPDPNHLAPCENKIGCKHDTRPHTPAAPELGVSCIHCFHCGKQVSTYHDDLVFMATATCPECTESGKDIDPQHDAAIARKAREDVAELLDDVRKYANGEYKEADLSDNEREMRIHLEYENRIWGIMRSLRHQSTEAPK